MTWVAIFIAGWFITSVLLTRNGTKPVKRCVKGCEFRLYIDGTVMRPHHYKCSTVLRDVEQVEAMLKAIAWPLYLATYMIRVLANTGKKTPIYTEEELEAEEKLLGITGDPEPAATKTSGSQPITVECANGMYFSYCVDHHTALYNTRELVEAFTADHSACRNPGVMFDRTVTQLNYRPRP